MADERHRILVISASATVSLMIRSLLRRWDMVAETGTDEAPGWDLVIADFDSPDPRLAEARRAGVPWLALLPSGRARGAADASAWVSKPIDADRLHEAVRRCLSETAPAAAHGIDVTVIDELWGGPANAGFRRVLEAFLGEARVRLDAIRAGLAAADRRLLQLEAHSMAGAASNVGAVALADAARALELAAPQAQAAHLTELAEALADVAERDLPVLGRLASGPAHD